MVVGVVELIFLDYVVTLEVDVQDYRFRYSNQQKLFIASFLILT